MCCAASAAGGASSKLRVIASVEAVTYEIDSVISSYFVSFRLLRLMWLCENDEKKPCVMSVCVGRTIAGACSADEM